MPKIYTESFKEESLITTTVKTLFTSKVYTINKNNAFLISIYVPYTSLEEDWGGLFITTNIKINGTWHNMGNSGYPTNAMVSSQIAQGSYFNTKYIDLIGNNIAVRDKDYEIQIQVKVSTYSKTASVNNIERINDALIGDANPGTALSWAQDQNHVTLTIEEVSL